MKQLVVVVALLFAANASAKDFGARVAEAKAAEATSGGAKYEQSLGSQVGAAIRTCVAPGSTAKANLGTFVLVAYVTGTGEMTEVEVEPANEVSRCFANHLQMTTLPAPPTGGLSTTAYPIEVEMRVEP